MRPEGTPDFRRPAGTVLFSATHPAHCAGLISTVALRQPCRPTESQRDSILGLAGRGTTTRGHVPQNRFNPWIVCFRLLSFMFNRFFPQNTEAINHEIHLLSLLPGIGIGRSFRRAGPRFPP